MAKRSDVPSPRLSHAILDLLRGQGRPLHGSEVAKQLQGYRRRAVSEALEALLFDGLIILGAGRQYRLAPGAISTEEHVEGILSAHPRGFGFVRTNGDDVFVPADAMAGAMHRDVVKVRVVARSSRGREGEVVEIVARGISRVAGLLRGKPASPWLEPDDARIRGPIEVTEALEGPAFRAGAAAVITVTRYPQDHRENAQGQILAVLGKPGEPDVEVSKLLLSYNIDESHHQAAVAEAQAISPDELAAEIAKREDLREVAFVTIDPHDARDHDDAVCVTRDEAGCYTAWIAIADVAWFVRPGSALDKQAAARGYS
ncbi:MAG TPA: RNB domain-containing ribonuclease, partial [Sorangium sp.]|nr:RNB domain-containing ribonuclease [Sorangium sp.]